MSKDLVTLKCGKCGSTRFELPKDPKPNDIVTCAGCKGQGTYNQVMASAKKAVAEDLKKALKKAGFTIR